MNEGKTEQDPQTGSTPESQIAIEYSWQSLNEIRKYAIDGLKRPAPGAPVGGVLFGARGENLVRILAWRPIRCEHSLEPGFQLPQKDRIHLGQFLQAARRDPELAEMHALGWFVSHIGTGMDLTESDLEFFDHFFPWSWQIALVIQPDRDGSATAGFFFRDAQGDVKADSCCRQFDTESSPDPQSGQELMLTDPAPQLHPPQRYRGWIPRGPRVWIWAVPVMLASIVGAMLLSRPAPQAMPPSLALRLVDDGAKSRFEWDKRAAAVQAAVRGSLQIRDGTSNMEVPLETKGLREGKFSYSRKTNDLAVRMTVYPMNAQPVEESARFVGSPVRDAGSEDAAQILSERDSLVDEAVLLREALRRETLRSSQLEEAIRILQARAAGEEPRRPKSTLTENK